MDEIIKTLKAKQRAIVDRINQENSVNEIPLISLIKTARKNNLDKILRGVNENQ